MTLDIKNNNIIVNGNLTEDKDFNAIKTAIESVTEHHNSLILKFYDTLVINSSLIGYLVNTVNKKAIKVHIQTANDTLYELIDYLGMNEMFNLQKI